MYVIYEKGNHKYSKNYPKPVSIWSKILKSSHLLQFQLRDAVTCFTGDVCPSDQKNKILDVSHEI